MRITVFKECGMAQTTKGAPFRIVEYPKCVDHAAWTGRIDGHRVAGGTDYAAVLQATLKRAQATGAAK